ncbi:glucokinase [Sulfuricella sp.]|uniref:glucokinase n=1 Tax=Sulfuricella sp. TaxID=2099377 RepID=UPI002CE89EE0|nr:glucokinase [Sulfuricella sp.]HUX65007.1 glucokinase [Sulfuricella sp.]
MNTSTTKTLLAGDIGGTKTLLRLSEEGRVLTERRFESAAYAGLEPIIAEFLRDCPSHSIASACFGVAGPVDGGQANITNLPWRIDAAAIAAEFGITQVQLINDFQAVAYGIEALGADDLLTLQAGVPLERGVRAVIGAGTGLGEGFMVWQGDHYEALPSEGSHADFAPADMWQAELLRYLAARFGHVSYERLASGPGLANIFNFLCDSEEGRASQELLAAIREGDPSAAISRFALAGNDRLAAEALDLFIRIYGAEAGNLALKVLARGGVYVAGGIAPQIIEKLKDGRFLKAFADKGRYAELLATIPVHVVLNPNVGLMGAERVAGRL